MVARKDGNPLNEVELVSDSLINNGGGLRAGTVITLPPDQSARRWRPDSSHADGIQTPLDGPLRRPRAQVPLGLPHISQSACGDAEDQTPR
jgi:hypothetical protein